jgi:hypothetical protein
MDAPVPFVLTIVKGFILPDRPARTGQPPILHFSPSKTQFVAFRRRRKSAAV